MAPLRPTACSCEPGLHSRGRLRSVREAGAVLAGAVAPELVWDSGAADEHHRLGLARWLQPPRR